MIEDGAYLLPRKGPEADRPGAVEFLDELRGEAGGLQHLLGRLRIGAAGRAVVGEVDAVAATLELIARADDKTVKDTVRTAIDEHIKARRKDKAFMGRLTARHERERELFERLAE